MGVRNANSKNLMAIGNKTMYNYSFVLISQVFYFFLTIVKNNHPILEIQTSLNYSFLGKFGLSELDDCTSGSNKDNLFSRTLQGISKVKFVALLLRLASSSNFAVQLTFAIDV